MPNNPSKLIISVKNPWPSGVIYRGRFPLGPTQIAGAVVSGFTVVGGLAAGLGAPIGVSFTWEPPTQNTDNSALTGGELTGYEVGVRIGGSAGTYPTSMMVDGAFTSADLIANIQPPLASGTYQAAVRTAGPTPGTWSVEASFTVP